MPAGDAQRTWFPKMVAVLRREWRPHLAMDELIALRNRLDTMLQSIRSERGIVTPMLTCSRCGSTGHVVTPQVSVRALILALARFEIAAADEVQLLEKSWNRYRGEKALDLYGREAGRNTAAAVGPACHDPGKEPRKGRTTPPRR